MTLAPVAPKPVRWEYMCRAFRCDYLDEMAVGLNVSGQEGWEACVVEKECTGGKPQFLIFACFKRPLPS